MEEQSDDGKWRSDTFFHKKWKKNGKSVSQAFIIELGNLKAEPGEILTPGEHSERPSFCQTYDQIYTYLYAR